MSNNVGTRAGQTPTPTIAVLLPVRNEQRNIRQCLDSILAQQGVTEIIVLDDQSTDDTAEMAAELLGSDPRAQLILGESDPPENWLGKPWACARLAAATNADVLVFVDADVVLEPSAVVASTDLLIAEGLAMLCPYPQQDANTALTRLIQPLLQWSWLTFIPYRYSMTAQPPSMAVGNGQLALFTRDAYLQVGGHHAVANEVVEDIALARALRSAGMRTAVVDGHQIATCKMYATDRELIDGYTKSLWQAFGPPVQQLSTLGLLAYLYLLPPIALSSSDRPTRVSTIVAMAAAVVGRGLVAHRTGQRILPEVAFAPVAVGGLIALTALSTYRRARGQLTWKGRRV